MRGAPGQSLQLPQGPRYERRGECLRCGRCCLNEDCSNLRISNGLATCSNHPQQTGKADTREPKCDSHPQAPPILIVECGYHFVDTWEGNRKVGPREV